MRFRLIACGAVGRRPSESDYDLGSPTAQRHRRLVWFRRIAGGYQFGGPHDATCEDRRTDAQKDSLAGALSNGGLLRLRR